MHRDVQLLGCLDNSLLRYCRTDVHSDEELIARRKCYGTAAIKSGVVIGRKGDGTRESFTVRKMSGGVGVERVFPLNSPVIDRIEVVRRGRVRRAKLYYLRELRGKAARIEERRDDRTKKAKKANVAMEPSPVDEAAEEE